MIHFHPLLTQKHDSWKSLEHDIELLPSEQERGETFEQFVYAYLKLHQPKYQILEIYREKELPLNYRQLLRLEKRDFGVDGAFVRNDGTYAVYQAKFRKGRATPYYSDLATFWAEGEYAASRYVIANSTALPSISGKKINGLQILADTFDKLSPEFFDRLSAYSSGQDIKAIARFSPDPHQERMIQKIVTGFQTQDRGKLIAACGVGKTLVSLWVAERMNSKMIIFFAPSLALIKQTLEEWSEQSQFPFSYLCVCSDDSVAQKIAQDIADFRLSEIDFPVTTDPIRVREFLVMQTDLKIVFSTYQSADVVVAALRESDLIFDLAIYDEAHRTAGTGESASFAVALNADKLRARKRLFMTATERIVSPRLKLSLISENRCIFSMDDEDTYGPVLDRYTFGEAISDDVISDYKVVIAALDQNEMRQLVLQNRFLTQSSDNIANDTETTAENLFKQILLCRTMKEFDLRKAITFHSSVNAASQFIHGSPGVSLPIQQILDAVWPPSEHRKPTLDSVNGNMSAGDRNLRLAAFEDSEMGMISNARCLTEGVDVPLTDCIYFADPKNSIIDIVQACGRALRKPRHVSQKKTSYFVVPIYLESIDDGLIEMNDERFETIHSVIQALRDQDERLSDWIDQMIIGIAKGKGKWSSHTESPLLIRVPTTFNLNKFVEQIQLRIATINKKSSRTQLKPDERIDRSSYHRKAFIPLGDYTHTSYYEKLVAPTILKFKTEDEILTSTQLKINHNNIAHTERLCLLEKFNRNSYKLTNLGKEFRRGQIEFEGVFKRAMLLHKGTNEVSTYPYRAIIRTIIEVQRLNFIEFLFGLYTSGRYNKESIRDSVRIIKEVREDYPVLHVLGPNTKKIVLGELNSRYNLSFSYNEVWGSTTLRNKYGYFKDHLRLIKGLNITNEGIQVDGNATGELRELLRSYENETDFDSESLSDNTIL